MEICLDIEKIILNQLKGALVFVTDPMNDGTHLEAVVVSDEFIGKPLIAQHRRVMTLLKESFNTDLHALKLKTYTLEKWKQLNGEAL